jgi:hypothetical protein
MFQSIPPGEYIPKDSNDVGASIKLFDHYNETFDPLPNIVSISFETNRLEFRFRSLGFSFNLFPVWQPYCWKILKCHSTYSVSFYPNQLHEKEIFFKINLIRSYPVTGSN